MSNQMYNYNSSYGGGSGLSSAYSSRLSNDPYLSDASLIGSSRYLSSDQLTSMDSAKYSSFDRGSSMYMNHSDGLRPPGCEIGVTGGFSGSKFAGGIGAAATPSAYSHSSWTGMDRFGAASDMDPTGVHGMKRSAEALYHQNVMGTHSTIGQNEALFSINSLGKRPRLETASNLPIYPQRPGEKDCAHYMLTRTCKFGDTCKFDHPLWVPEGGIPDWKEVPLVPTSESLPERPGEPDCPYYIKTQRCKFGFRCKFNHPKDTLNVSAGGVGVEGTESTDNSILPERPTEPICSFYAKTGKCKFGANCVFHHPQDFQVPSTVQDSGSIEQPESVAKDHGAAGGDSNPTKTFVPFTPALLHNSKGLPIRPGEPDCPFYLKTGSCKYAATCRYNHPDRYAIDPPVAPALGHANFPSAASNLHIGVFNQAANLLPNLDPRLAQASLGVGLTIYPQRPGQLECDFYMKTGQCKFGEKCKFHHPIDRSAPTTTTTKQAVQQNVKLTLAGLPRREGTVICPYYMKTGTCKYGVTCRFDHPPPGEAIAMAAVQGSGTVTGTGVEDKVAAGSAEEEQ